MTEMPIGLLGSSHFTPYDEALERSAASALRPVTSLSQIGGDPFGGLGSAYIRQKLNNDLINYALRNRISLRGKYWCEIVLKEIAIEHFKALSSKRKRGGQPKLRGLGLLAPGPRKSDLIVEVEAIISELKDAGLPTTDTEAARHLVARTKYVGRTPDELKDDEIDCDQYATDVSSLQVKISRQRKQCGEMKRGPMSRSTRKLLNAKSGLRRS